MKYRDLIDGDIIAFDDEFKYGEKWKKAISTVGMVYGCSAISHVKYRRPIKRCSQTAHNTRFGAIAAWLKQQWQRLRKARNVARNITAFWVAFIKGEESP